MLEDLWLHTYFEDPKAVTDTVEDDEFNPDEVAETLRRMKEQRQQDLPNDFEPL